MSYIELNVSKNKLLNNISNIRKYVENDTLIMVIAKANAYGLGAANVCKVLENHVNYFGFATLNEALEVRSVVKDCKITLLSEPRKSDIPILADFNIDCACYSIKCIKNINEYLINNTNKTISTHFKVNTGLNRLGNDLGDNLFGYRDNIGINNNNYGDDIWLYNQGTLDYWLNKTNNNFKKISIWSHLQNSEFNEENRKINELQLANFMKMTNKVSKEYNLLRHISNSYAIEFLDNRYTFDMVRGGVMIWKDTFELKVQIKYVFKPEKNSTVGYGCNDITPHKYICDGKHKAAALAIGYADGLSTKLSYKGYVMIKGQKCDIISPVMMDMTVVKIPEGLEVEDEDWCTFIGSGDDEAMTTEYLQSLTGENSRELMAHLGRRIDRNIVN
jgi:alanine racemase